MDIKLGKLNLTKEQLQRSNDLKSQIFRGLIQDESGEVTAVCSVDLSPSELGVLKGSLSGLSKDPIPEKTPEEIKKDQDYSAALDKIATNAGLSKDEKEALKENRSTAKENIL